MTAVIFNKNFGLLGLRQFLDIQIDMSRKEMKLPVYRWYTDDETHLERNYT